MRRHEVSGGDFLYSTNRMDGSERPLFKRGVRRDEGKGLNLPFAITFTYLPSGGYIEHESIEYRRQDAHFEDPPYRTMYVVREHPPSGTLVSLTLPKNGWCVHGNIWAVVETLGHTLEGGLEESPRQPWARFIIEDPHMLKVAFGSIDTSGRQPNETGTYVILNSTVDRPLVAKTVIEFNGRPVTITMVGEITINYGPDVDGKPGPLLKAFFRKVWWVEGDITKPVGMMA